MKKFMMKATLIAAFVAVAGYGVYVNKEKDETILSDTMLANVEALANDENWLTDWWDSKVYACQEVETWKYDCMPYKDIPRDDDSWEVDYGNFQPDDIVCGMFKVWDTDCVGGNEYAHCWECE